MTVDDKAVRAADAIGTVSTVDTTDAAKSLETESETTNKTEQEQKQKQGKPYDDVFRLEELKETYRRIMEYLDRKLEEERLTALQRWIIQETTKKVTENLAVNMKR